MGTICRGRAECRIAIVSICKIELTSEHITDRIPFNSTARLRRLGLRNLQIDDYLMLFAVVWYTLLCTALNQVASGGGSNLLTAEDKAALTDESIAERIRGSKWVFVSEHSFVLCVWSLKACMLVIYGRITYVHSFPSRALMTSPTNTPPTVKD
jgi:hypothetical protein